MKKAIAFVIVLISLIGSTALSFAQTDKDKTASKEVTNNTEVITGKIISIDTNKSEIVIKEDKTGAEKTILADTKTIAASKIGEKVKVTLKAGTNTAEKVKEVVYNKTTTAKSKK